jgi:hypothetical protein
MGSLPHAHIIGRGGLGLDRGFAAAILYFARVNARPP